MSELGKITLEIGATPDKHEIATATFLAQRGRDIYFLKASENKGVRTPDILMGGAKWEIKSPKANSKHTINHAFRSALGQSCHIIFDLRRSKAPVASLKKLQKEFELEKRAKHLLIISKEGELIDIER